MTAILEPGTTAPGPSALDRLELDRLELDRLELDRLELDRPGPDRAQLDRPGPDRAQLDRAELDLPERDQPLTGGSGLERLPAPAVAAAPERPALVLTRRDVRTFGAVMIGLFVLAVGVQPLPDGPLPDAPLYADVLNNVTTFALLALVAGTLAARGWSLWAGLVTGGSMLALSVSCPLSGHHEYAAWWGVQLAAVAAMTVLPATLLRRTRGR